MVKFSKLFTILNFIIMYWFTASWIITRFYPDTLIFKNTIYILGGWIIGYAISKLIEDIFEERYRI